MKTSYAHGGIINIFIKKSSSWSLHSKGGETAGWCSKEEVNLYW